jgi:hypothetical protein
MTLLQAELLHAVMGAACIGKLLGQFAAMSLLLFTALIKHVCLTVDPNN